MDKRGLRTWLEIDTKAIRHNFSVFRKLLPRKTKLMAIAKSNAYGHGLVDFSKLIANIGADWIGVDSITEARRLRKEGIKTPILVLGYTLPEHFKEAAANNISITISTFENLQRAAHDHLTIHLKIDTGMHRQGFALKELPRALATLKKGKANLEGMYTHFADAKNPAFPAYTKKQLSIFDEACALTSKAGFAPIRHASATSGTFLFAEAHFDMARIGIGMYGLWPSHEIASTYKNKIKLKPALSWKTIIAEIKKVPKGRGVGYDLAEYLMRDSRLAILPIGYWHGYPRALSSLGWVLVNKKRAKVIGRISMDMVVVDITDIKNAKVGTEATLIGREGQEEISVEELALLSGTSGYEFVTRLNPLMKRIYK